MCQGLGAPGEAWQIQGHCLPLSPDLEDIWAGMSPGITRGMTVHPVPVEELGLGEAEERNNSKILAGGRVPHLHTAGRPKFITPLLSGPNTQKPCSAHSDGHLRAPIFPLGRVASGPDPVDPDEK